MGLITNTLVLIKDSMFKRFRNTPGKSIVVKSEGVSGQVFEKELFGQSGIINSPPNDTRGIYIPIDKSGRYGAIIACQNYNLNIAIEKGETIIYSSTIDGKTIKSKIHLKSDGSIELNGNSKRFVTHSELNTALQGFISALNINLGTKLDGAGAPGVLSIDISTAATSTLKTDG